MSSSLIEKRRERIERQRGQANRSDGPILIGAVAVGIWPPSAVRRSLNQMLLGTGCPRWHV